MAGDAFTGTIFYYSPSEPDLNEDGTDCDGNYRLYGDGGDPAIRVYVA